MKSYNILQIERIKRYIALRERKAGSPLTAEQEHNLTQYWIAKYALHFRKWHTSAIRLRIVHSEGDISATGSGEFKRVVKQLKTENKRVIEVRKM